MQVEGLVESTHLARLNEVNVALTRVLMGYDTGVQEGLDLDLAVPDVLLGEPLLLPQVSLTGPGSFERKPHAGLLHFLNPELPSLFLFLALRRQPHQRVGASVRQETQRVLAFL